MRVLFLGSGAFAIPSFQALVGAGHEVVAVVTQPDKQKGRGRAVSAPPLKPVAEASGVSVLQPGRIRAPEALEALRALAPQVQVVVAYGQILPRAILEIPPLGTVNVHASLLPHLRGAAPIQWAIARGDAETGVTTMLLDEGLDTGPTLLATRTPIGPEETAAELEPRLATLGADLLVASLRGLEAGSITPQPQDESLATHAPILRKENGRLVWDKPGATLALEVRAFNPWPGTVTSLGGRSVRVLRARAEQATHGAPPGTLVAIEKEGLVVACGGGSALRIVEIQPESRRPMDAFAFAMGARLAPGLRFEP